MLCWTQLMYFFINGTSSLVTEGEWHLTFQVCFTLVVLNSCFIVPSFSIDICIEYWPPYFICKLICLWKWTIMCGLLQQECKWCTVWCTQTLPRCFFQMLNIVMIHVWGNVPSTRKKSMIFLFDLHETYKWSTELCADLVYQISPKLGNKWGEGIKMYICACKWSVVCTEPVVMKFMVTRYVVVAISCFLFYQVKLIAEHNGQNFIHVWLTWLQFSQNLQLLINISWRCLYQISPNTVKKCG